MKDVFVMQSSFGSCSDKHTERDRELTGCSVNFQSKKIKAERHMISNEKFPCIIPHHNHKLGECREFFDISPQKRADSCRLFHHQYCRVCLQTNSECRPLKCVNLDKVPSILICRDCKKMSKRNKNRPLFSIFFCFSGRHLKPANIEIISALEEYVPSFKAASISAPVQLALQAVSDVSKPSASEQLLSPENSFSEGVPSIFNTETGEHGDPPDIDLVSEINEDSIAVMQVLNLNGRHVLTLFDRGANQHLIKGELAEELGIQSRIVKPSSIGVLCGDKKWTDSSQYEMFLGPTQAGKYHQIIANGIKSVTAEYPKYNLQDLNQEVLEHTDIPHGTCLPEYVGGDQVGLLIGLKHSELEPVCIFTLPSGVGVYRSPFKDAFGSYYCYGGPSAIFSSMNRKSTCNVKCFRAYMLQMANEYKSSVYPSLPHNCASSFYQQNKDKAAQIIPPN